MYRRSNVIRQSIRQSHKSTSDNMSYFKHRVDNNEGGIPFLVETKSFNVNVAFCTQVLKYRNQLLSMLMCVKSNAPNVVHDEILKDMLAPDLNNTKNINLCMH